MKVVWVSRIIQVLAVTAASVFTSCKTPQPAPPAAVAAPEPLYEWNGDGVPGRLSMNISLKDQRAQLYKDGKNVGWTRVATGTSRHPTPQGNYSIIEKQREKYSSKYGTIVDSNGNVIDGDAAVGREAIKEGTRFVAAPMPYWMRLTSYGIGMHAGNIPNPGYPASHGCIRLPHYMAQKLFEETTVGTPVKITH